MLREIYIHKKEHEVTNKLNSKLISEEYKSQLIDFYRKFEENSLLPDLIGKSVEVNKYQFPDIYQIVKSQAEILGISIPKIYIYESFFYDVNAEGYDNPWIQLSSKTIEDCTEKELEFMIGRQMCHIKENHIKYEILCEQFSKALGIVSKVGTEAISFIPGMSTVSGEALEMYASSFKLTACQWSRISEYTADFCAYILCNDIEASISAIKKQILNSKKLSDEMKISNFINQSININRLDSPISIYSVLDEQIPYGPFRIKELIKFSSNSKTKEYLKK